MRCPVALVQAGADSGREERRGGVSDGARVRTWRSAVGGGALSCIVVFASALMCWRTPLRSSWSCACCSLWSGLRLRVSCSRKVATFAHVQCNVAHDGCWGALLSRCVSQSCVMADTVRCCVCLRAPLEQFVQATTVWRWASANCAARARGMARVILGGTAAGDGAGDGAGEGQESVILWIRQ